MLFVNNLSPFAVKLIIGGQTIGIRWYGLAYALGFALAHFALLRASRSGLIKNLDKKAVEQMDVAVVVGVLAGGRLGYVVQNPAKLLSDPLFALKVWEGGMAFFGGLVGLAIALLWVCRARRIPMWPVADVLAIPASIALAFGRLANFANRELWGRPTESDWGVIYPNVDQLPRHPSELYEAASHFLLALLLWWCTRNRRGAFGNAAALFLFGYGAMRFLTERYREEPIILAQAITAGQLASVVMAVLGLILYIVRRKATGEQELNAV